MASTLRTARTRSRVVEAALESLVGSPLRSLTIEDVAARAGVSRQTVYRHFGSRDGLVEALVLRVEHTLTQSAIQAVAPARDLEEAIRLAVESLLAGARAHPLVDRLLQSDPEELLPLITLGEGPVMSTAGPVVRDLLSQYVPEMNERDTGLLADLLSRLVVSFTIAPGDLGPTEAADAVARLVMGRLAGVVPGGGPPSGD